MRAFPFTIGNFRQSRREFGSFVARATFFVGVPLAASIAAGCRRHASTGAPDRESPGTTNGGHSAETHIGEAADRGLEATTLRTFHVGQFLTIGAVCERLLPRDGDPAVDPGALGARDLGVPNYVDAMLATPELKRQRDLVLQVLPILDRQARIRFGGRAFHEASVDEQEALLATWQRGRGGDRRFFETLLTLPLEGALGDPKYGGNRDGKGWALVGFRPGAAGMPGTLLPGGR